MRKNEVDLYSLYISVEYYRNNQDKPYGCSFNSLPLEVGKYVNTQCGILSIEELIINEKNEIIGLSILSDTEDKKTRILIPINQNVVINQGNNINGIYSLRKCDLIIKHNELYKQIYTPNTSFDTQKVYYRKTI